jgi:hypothetical protein
VKTCLTIIDLLTTFYNKLANARFEEINTAVKTTFEWIWAEDIGLTSWLKNDKPLFWINGKPGSGKSTLMKYIWMHDTVQKFFASDPPGRKRLAASFYFHGRGELVQKTLEGMLMGVLNHLLWSEPKLVQVLLPKFKKRKRKDRGSWTFALLKEAFEEIRAQSIIKVDIFLFFDALDEHYGPPEVIADFVKSITQPVEGSTTKIKICFSSRQWNTFLEEFSSEPGFAIHEHTSNDVIAYIKDRFNSNSATAKMLKSTIPAEQRIVEELISSIALKADGVFVWLRLVMEDLVPKAKAAYTDGNALEPLIDIVDSYPDDLKTFFETIIDTISQEYRLEAFALIEIIHRGGPLIQLQELDVMVGCAMSGTLKGCTARVRLDISNIEHIKKFIRSRSGGLVEIVNVSDKPTAQFMHQTVTDFISKPGFRSKILGNTYSFEGENGFSFLTKYILACIIENWKNRPRSKSTSSTEAAWTQMSGWQWDSFAQWAKQAELTTGRSQSAFWDAAESEAFRHSLALHEAYEQNKAKVKNFVVWWAVRSDLRLYVKEVLEQQPDIVNNNGEYTLLHLAVHISVFRENIGADGMVRLLLQFNANRSAVFQGRTPFQTLFSHCFEGYGGSGGSDISTNILSIARALLKDGENPNCKLVTRIRRHQSSWCRPLHVSNQAMIELLLEYGADINALDASGYTPLDIFCGAVGNIYEIGDHIRPQEGFDVVMLLLSHGARLSGTFDPSLYLGIIQRHGLTIPEIMINMPTLNQHKMKKQLYAIRSRIRNLTQK